MTSGSDCAIYAHDQICLFSDVSRTRGQGIARLVVVVVVVVVVVAVVVVVLLLPLLLEMDSLWPFLSSTSSSTDGIHKMCL